MMLVSDAVRQSKKELGMKFYIEPFRQNSTSRRSDPKYSSVDECIRSETQRYKNVEKIRYEEVPTELLNMLCAPGGPYGVPL